LGSTARPCVGGYAGVFIQLVIPALLVLLARRFQKKNVGLGPNPHASPLRAACWPIAILLWAAACLAVNTTFHVLKWRGVIT
jgi:hypothetical protein